MQYKEIQVSTSKVKNIYSAAKSELSLLQDKAQVKHQSNLKNYEEFNKSEMNKFFEICKLTRSYIFYQVPIPCGIYRSPRNTVQDLIDECNTILLGCGYSESITLTQGQVHRLEYFRSCAYRKDCEEYFNTSKEYISQYNDEDLEYYRGLNKAKEESFKSNEKHLKEIRAVQQEKEPTTKEIIFGCVFVFTLIAVLSICLL